MSRPSAELDLPSRRVRPTQAAIAAALVVALMLAVAALARADTPVPSRDVSGAGELVARLEAEVADLRAEVTRQDAQVVQLEHAVAGLSGEQAARVVEIEALVRHNRDLVVAAFINGGEARLRRLLGSSKASEYQWRTYLYQSEAGEVHDASQSLAQIHQRTDAHLVSLAQRLDRARARSAADRARLGHRERALADARAQLVVAQAWVDSDAAVARGSHGEAPAEAWARLRYCESSGNYTAIDDSGVYRGAYQFDLPTWRSVGGYGDPALAPAAEQDARARALYALRGRQPWPVCGRFLP